MSEKKEERLIKTDECIRDFYYDVNTGIENGREERGKIWVAKKKKRKMKRRNMMVFAPRFRSENIGNESNKFNSKGTTIYWYSWTLFAPSFLLFPAHILAEDISLIKAKTNNFFRLFWIVNFQSQLKRISFIMKLFVNSCVHAMTSFSRSDSPFVRYACVYIYGDWNSDQFHKIILDKVYIYIYAVISGLKFHARRVCDNKE